MERKSKEEGNERKRRTGRGKEERGGTEEGMERRTNRMGKGRRKMEVKPQKIIDGK